MFAEALTRLRSGASLSADQAAGAVGAIMDGTVPPAQIAAFLTALAIKSETVEEVAGCARAMRRRMVRVEAPRGPVVDTCGTGGDGRGTFNISTAAAILVAACGLTVAKHGNRAASSRCGSADVLEALGVRIDRTPPEMAAALRATGFAFLMAPTCHPAMKHAGPVRRELGFRTIFNLVGPLTNPAGADVQVIGVYAPQKAALMARVARLLGTRKTIVVHGAGGTDELTPCGSNRLWDVARRGIRTASVGPRPFGLKRCRLEDLAGGSAQENAALIEKVLAGEPGPRTDAVVMNAAVALVAAGRFRAYGDGAEAARAALRDGSALRKLEQLRRLE